MKETIEMNNVVEDSTSLDLFWKHVFENLDAWSIRVSNREEQLLQSVNQVVSQLKINKQNFKELLSQLIKEQNDIERMAREEFLIYTTGLQNLYPIKSYEEINQIFDRINEKKVNFSNIPFDQLANEQFIEKIVMTVEKYVEHRKQSRSTFIGNVKGTAAIIKENQKNLLNLYTKELKNIIFPLNKYFYR